MQRHLPFILAVIALSSCLGCRGCRDVQPPSGWPVSSDAADARPDAGRRDTQTDDSAVDVRVDVDGGRLTDTGPEAGDTGDITPPDAKPSWCDPATPTPKVPTAQSCGTTVYGTDSQFEQTPRETGISLARRIEWLILESTDAFVAPDCLYRRVKREVAQIRETILPKVDRYKYLNSPPPGGGKGLFMHVSAETAKAIERGEYQAWRCLNQHYEKTRHHVNLAQGAQTGRVRLIFEGFYDLTPLISAYSKLPGLAEHTNSPVERLPTLTNGGAKSDICLDIDGSVHRYVFYANRLSASPPRARFIYVRASANGALELKDTWEKPSERPRPKWLAEVCN